MAVEVTREVSSEDFPEFPVIGFRVQCFLVFPLLLTKEAVLLLESAVSKNPRRGWRQQVNTLKERPVLQNRATGDELSEPSGIHPPQFRTHGKNRFGFRSEIERVLRLVIVDPVHAIAIVEKHRDPSVLI